MSDIIPLRKKIRWAVDYDYVSKLSEHEKLWLSHFTEYYYAGNPHRCKLIILTPEQKKESWTRNNKASYDIMSNLLLLPIQHCPNI